MRLTLLGTGNAAGMPLYGCHCEYCVQALESKALRRTACSAQLDIDDRCYLVDAGQVNLTDHYPAGSLSSIFLTHFHPDHVQGLFHLRWGIGDKIPVYIPPDDQGCADLFKHPGLLDFKPKNPFEPFTLDGLTVTPIPLMHSKSTHGYLFEQRGKTIAYLTDTKGLSTEAASFLRKHTINLMVIDCSFVPGSDKNGHNNLDDIFIIDLQTSPTQIVLTHIGHDFDIWLKQNPDQLPAHIVAGHDGMVLS